MKKILLLLVFIGLTYSAKSQNASVEKSVTGIQTGVLGIWVHNETKLSNPLTLRTEAGMDFGAVTFTQRLDTPLHRSLQLSPAGITI